MDKIEKALLKAKHDGALEGKRELRNQLLCEAQEQANEDNTTAWFNEYASIWEWVEGVASELGCEDLDYTDWLNGLKEAKKSELGVEK